MRASLYTAAVAGLFLQIASAGSTNGIFARAACGGDNCNRALPRGVSSGSVDCSSFLATTVYGCAATSTVQSTTTVTANLVSTRTVTSTLLTTATYFDYTETSLAGIPTGPNGPANKNKRQGECSSSTVEPTRLPQYASACTSAARYSSACSCLGIKPTIITSADGAAVTVTSVTTNTVTISSAVTVTTTAYRTTTATYIATGTIQPVSGYFRLVLPGGRYITVGTVNSTDPINDPNNYFLTPTKSNNAADATVFYLNQKGNVQAANSSNKYSAQFTVFNAGTGDDLIHFHPYAYGIPLKCALSDPSRASGALTCLYGADQRFFNLCDGKVYISNTRKPGPACAFVDLQAVASSGR